MSAEQDIERGERYGFGRNWQRFLTVLDEPRIRTAEASLREMLGVSHLRGQRFLDVGSGSGIMSLAARRLGARVHSFDYDARSVACTAELKRRFFDDDTDWEVGQASVLDAHHLRSLGNFEVVYSWGVLHHTGALWRALDHVTIPVAAGGKLFIAIYNDEGLRSRMWREVKRLYCSNRVARVAIGAAFLPWFAVEGAAADLYHLRNPLRRHLDPSEHPRGMRPLTDWTDWLGGYPFEVARPEAIFDFYRKRGYVLERLTTGSSGCNQFVFTRPADGKTARAPMTVPAVSPSP